MHIFKRQEVIPELLSLLDIPQLIFPFRSCETIGPSDPEFFKEYEERRRKMEALATDALEMLSDEELWELSETPGAREIFEMEYGLSSVPKWYAGGFGVDVRKADYSFWSKMNFWTLEEATCLSIGFTPEKMPVDGGPPGPFDEVMDFFFSRKRLFERAFVNNDNSPDEINPKELLAWVQKKDIEVPDEMADSISNTSQTVRPAMLETVDARKYESALKVILGLMASQYGYRGGTADKDMKKDVVSGLGELGLNLDVKTVNRLFSDAVKSLERFRVQQKKRDYK